MQQVDDKFPSGLRSDVPLEYVLRQSEITFYDALSLRRITLDPLCYPRAE